MKRKGFLGGVLVGGGLLILWFLWHFTGLQFYTVMSGSMEPTLPVGSLVCAISADGGQLQKGDVIVYQQGENKIVHRIWEISPQQRTVITKGDANENPDVAPVPFAQIQGRLIWSVPWMGYPGLVLGGILKKMIIGVAAVWLAVSVVVTIGGNRSKRKEELMDGKGESKKNLWDDTAGNLGNSMPADGRTGFSDRQGASAESGGHGGEHFHSGRKVSGTRAFRSGKIP